MLALLELLRASSIAAMSLLEPMMMPTRGASTSVRSNSASVCGLGDLRIPCGSLMRAMSRRAVVRRTRSRPRQHTRRPRAAGAPSPERRDVEHPSARGDDGAVALARCPRGSPRRPPARGPGRVITSPEERSPGSRADASTTVTAARDPTRARRPPGRPGRVARSSRSSRSLRSRGSTACVSGSPKRTLYSSTLGPSGVSIRPAYSTPWNGVPRRASSSITGWWTSARTRSRNAASIPATGE